MPGLANRGDEEREQRLEDDDVAGGDGQQHQDSGRAEDRRERPATDTFARRGTVADDEREPAAADRDDRRRDRQRQPCPTERVERRIDDRRDRAAERDRGLPHAERPAAPRSRVRTEERPRARDRHDRRPEAEDEERPEEDLLRAGGRSDGEPRGADGRPDEHRAARADPVDEEARSDQRHTCAEQPGRQHRAELEQRQVEVVEELRPDSR